MSFIKTKGLGLLLLTLAGCGNPFMGAKKGSDLSKGHHPGVPDSALAPIVANHSLTTQMNVPVSGRLVGVSPVGDDVTFEIVTSPTLGTLSLDTDTGDVTYTPNSGQIGADSFTYRAKAGARTSTIATVFVTISNSGADTTPPAVALSITLNSPLSSPSSDTTPTLDVGVVAEAGQIVKIYKASTTAGCTVGNLIGQASGAATPITVTTSALTAGTYTLRAVTEDSSGNASACSSANLSYTVDDTAPALTLVEVQTGLTVDVTFGEAVASGALTAINYTVSGSGKGTLSDHPNSVALVSGNKYRLTWSSGEMFIGGNITITAADTEDASGNVTSSSSATDTSGGLGTAPTVTGLANDSVLAHSKTWNWGCSETCTYRYLINTTASSSPSGAYDGTDTATQATGTGTYYIHVQAKDAAGNESAVVHVSALLGNNAPTLTTVSTLTGGNEDNAATIAYSDLAAAADEADADGDTLSFRIEAVSTGTLTKNSTPVVGGTTLISSGDSVEWTPAANANGTLNAFTVKAWDGGAASATAIQVRVSVTAVNDAPVISDVANTSTSEDTAKAVSFTITDVDSTLTCGSSVSMSSSSTSIVANASVVWSGTAPNCTATITPVANATGTTTITLTATDGSLTDSDTFDLSVNSVSDAPVISDQSNTTTAEDTAKAVTFTITDDDSTLSCATSVAMSSSNTSVVANSAVVWSGTAPSCTATITPVANATGTSTITFTVSDGTLTDADSFVLTVTAVNDAPVISDQSNTSTAEDTAKAVTFSITDVDSTLTCGSSVSMSSSDTAVVANSAVVWSGTAPSCTATITPILDATGTTTITFTVTDGSLTASDTFDFTVNVVTDPPTISSISDTSTLEDTAKAVSFTINDTDTTLSCGTAMTMSSSNTSLVANSSVVWSGTAPSCTGTITPSANATGTATITFTVSDGALTDSDSFVLSVTAVNDAPAISDQSDTSTAEDTAKAVSFSITDVDSTLTCGSSVSMSSSNTSVVANSAVVWSGTAPNCTATITPVANATGTSTITFTVTDGTLTANDTFDLSVTAANDAPVISDQSNTSTAEDSAKAVSFTITDIDSTLTCGSSVSMSSSDTSVVANSAVVWSGTAPSCTATITPAANATGTSTITFTVSDGSLTASDAFVLTVTAVNDAPVISDQSDTSTSEDTAKAVSFSITDVDSTLSCGSSVSMSSSNTSVVANSAVAWSGTAPSCTATITPVANATGTSTITLTVTDGSLTANDPFVLTVNADNDAPTISNIANTSTAEDTDKAISFTINDIDSTLTCGASVSMSSSNTSIVANSAVVWSGTAPSCTGTITPVANANGTATITFTVTDGSLTANDTFDLTVNAVNDAPVISDQSDTSTSEDTAKAVSFSITDVDSTLSCGSSVSMSSSNTSVVANSAVVWSGTAPSCTATITPATNATGTSTITLTVSDGSLTAADPFVLTVNGDNDAPTISNIADTSTNEDTAKAVSFTIGDVDSTLTCGASVSMSSSNTSVVANSAVVWSGTAPSCTGTITPVANATGTSTITFTVSDGSLSANDTFVLTVNAVNDAPVISDQSDTSTVEDTAKAVSFSITDVDSTLSCGSSVSMSSSNTSVVANSAVVWSGTAPSCTATITPAANATGTSTITLTVTDGSLTANDTFVLTVTADNDAPTISNIADTSTNEDTAKAVSFTINDTDSTLTCGASVSMSSSDTGVVASSSVVWSGTAPSCTGTITPVANVSGTTTITFTVTDGSLTANDTFVLTVNAVNDAPTLTRNNTLTLQAGTSGTITAASHLAVGDIDNTASQITYTVTSVPTGGTLKKNGSNISASGTFTQNDLDSGLITYLHGSSTSSTLDSFNFTVSDGAGGSISSTTFNLVPVVAPQTLTRTSPASTPGTATSVTIEASGGSVTSGRTVKFYTDSACTGTQFGSNATANGSNVASATSTVSSDGSYLFYATVTANSVVSVCSTVAAAYTLDTDAPAAPTTLALNNPASSPSNDTTPQIRVSGGGVASGSTVTLFTNSGCTTQVGSQLASTTQADVTSSTLTANTYGFYAKVTDEAGNASVCSTATVAYVLDLTAPTVTTVTAQTTLTVDVTFSEAMSTGVTTASNYTISGTGKGTLAANPTSVAIVSGNTYRLTWSTGSQVGGGDITIAVANATDVAGNAVSSSGTHTGGGIAGSDVLAPDAPTGVTLYSTYTSNTSSSTSYSPDISFTHAGTDNGSAGFSHYEYKIIDITDSNSTEVDWTNFGTGKSYRITGLSLTNTSTYKVQIRAVDNAGNASGSADSATNWTVAAITANPYDGQGLTAVGSLSDGSLSGNVLNSTRAAPSQFKVFTISGNLNWDTAGYTSLFLRAQDLVLSTGYTIQANGSATTTKNGSNGGSGGGGGGGSSSSNPGGAGGSGGNGTDGSGTSKGLAGTGSAGTYASGFTYGSGGAGTTGGGSLPGAGGAGANGAGGGGGGSGGSTGGGGGAGGGLVAIVAESISGTATVQATGGTGLQQAKFGGHGGGGVVWVATESYNGGIRPDVKGAGYGLPTYWAQYGATGTSKLYQINADGSYTERNFLHTFTSDSVATVPVLPFPEWELPDTSGLSDATLNDTATIDASSYSRVKPYAAKTLTINGTVSAASTGPTVMFLRAETLAMGTSAILSVDGAAGSGLIGGRGGSGGGSANTSTGTNGQNGGSATDGGSFNNSTAVGGIGTAQMYNDGFTYGNGGNGGKGADIGSVGGSGGTAGNGFGGGGGGSYGQNTVGGAGGGGGGMIVIIADSITGTGTVRARGGAGVLGTSNRDGGGGGGGVIWIATKAYTGGLTADVTGGAPGGTGNNAAAGSAGTARIFKLNNDGTLTLKSFSDTW
ncbi:MAG TPA: tandem-95 repeat protein [Bdellovibrionota bacterium]|nr:tandem-95 repeat protein [Bdellovibrionota bacterium]